MKKNRIQNHDNGFILPTVLLISIVMIAIGLSLASVTTSIRASLTSAYVMKMTTEASNAGVVYANYCYQKGGQTWTNLKPLTQSTDCFGTIQTNYPAYLQSYTTYHSTFSVGAITDRGDGAQEVTSVGTVNEVAARDPSQMLDSQSYTQKQVLSQQVPKASVSASGVYKTCAIVSGELYCWGANNSSSVGEPVNGQLGDGTTINSNSPVKVDQSTGLAGKTIVAVVSAQYHNCALTQDGKVFCWGNNDYGQLGDGKSGGYESKPVEVIGLDNKTVTAIGASGNTSCAIASGTIYCWGDNSSGTVGAGSTQSIYTQPTMVNLPAGYTATKMATSGGRSYNMCAIIDASAYCWGDNSAGQIGNGVSGTANVTSPVQVSGGALMGKTVTDITQDGNYSGNPTYPHTCAVATGAVYCWGANDYGQVGDGTITARSLPTTVSTSGILNGKIITQVSAGSHHTCALTSDGLVACWGDGSSGQLGTNTYASSSVPVAIYTDGALSGLTITSIGGGTNRGCAIAGYSTYCWGLNTNGQIGDGTTQNRNAPTKSKFLEPKSTVFLF